MRIAITGGTGFVGRHLIERLANAGHSLRCWHRPTSDRGGLERFDSKIEWVPGELGDDAASAALVQGCEAVVHCGLHRAGRSFMGAEGELVEFVRRNVLGTIQLIEAARAANVPRFVFVSTCAVHDVILDDRPLDEAHPLWAQSHYGAHKGAIEKFVHSYGLGEGYAICAVRPTGIYGRAHPPEQSKWFDLVRSVVHGEPVRCERGGKEVHVADVAKAIDLLLHADANQIAGQAFNCCDRYVSQHDVATRAKRLAGSDSEILGTRMQPRHQIETKKLRALGMTFGGDELLEATIGELIEAAR
ncbi:MAG: NAD(P)-dependent oxidoreductase [Planctomycetaceae bacterium]